MLYKNNDLANIDGFRKTALKKILKSSCFITITF